jgi:glucosamine-6-phosphate isomerase
MKIFIADTYRDMSEQATNQLLSLIEPINNPVICPASGDTPAGLYKELIEQVYKQDLNASDWNFVGLDEWGGMNGDDEGSCRFHLDNQLFRPLWIPDERVCFFNGRAKDGKKECERIESFIREHGGIDIVILGLGMNGHAGMNEPGTDPQLRSHVTDIDTQTQQVGQKYFKEKQELSKGLTLGITTILEARNIILMVSGQQKAEIVKQVLEGEISPQVPTSLLRNHPGLKVYLDKEAASLLQTI